MGIADRLQKLKGAAKPAAPLSTAGERIQKLKAAQTAFKPPATNGGMSARLLKLKAAAEERGPVVYESAIESGEWDEPQPLVLPQLPPIDPEVLFPETAEERALAANRCAGLDCETFLMQPGRRVPRLVVTGYQSADGRQAIVTGDPRDPTVHARAFLAFTEAIVRDFYAMRHVGATPETAPATYGIGNILVNQNISFDFAAIAEDAHQADKLLGKVGDEDSLFEQVMTRIFEMLDLRLVEDTMLREQLIDLAEGTLGKDFESLTKDNNPRRKKYGLKELSKKYLGVDLDKLTYRLGYHRFLNKALNEYPAGAVKYLTDDVESALLVCARQQVRATLHGLEPGQRIPNSADQSNAAFSFTLLSAWGIRTNLSKVQQLDADLDRQARQMFGVLQASGLVRASGPKAGTRDLKLTHKLVAEAYEAAGLPVPLTKSGKNVSTAGAVLEDIAMIRLRGSTKDVVAADGTIDETELFRDPLYAYSHYTSIQKLQNTYLPVLYEGTKYPINASFDIIKETGRISCYRPNLTNLPRGGSKTILQRLQSRVRQCFVPRPGFVFCSVDFNTLELCTLAQVCIWMLGESKLAEAINSGLDPHLLMAAEQFLNMSYEEALARKKEKDVADMRQMVKAANFGLPGGLGIHTLIEYAKASYNVFLSEDEARILKEKWLAAWPEMRGYFNRIKMLMKGFDDRGQTIGDIEQYVSGRIRGRTRYTAACNTFFQGLAADGAKHALNKIQRASYLRNGPLYGSRAVAFVHDEIIMEHPEHLAAERGLIQAEIMVKAMQEVCPDVRISAAPALMRCWLKEAEDVYDSKGRLIPYELEPTQDYYDKKGKLIRGVLPKKQLAAAPA